MSGNSQTAHTHRASVGSVHQAAKLVAALLRIATVTAWRNVMAAYRRVYDSRHLQANWKEPGPASYAR